VTGDSVKNGTMLSDMVRDAPLGQVIRWATKNRYLQYPEEKADFKLPDCWLDLMNHPDLPLPVARLEDHPAPLVNRFAVRVAYRARKAVGTTRWAG
jgi:hypothetical protein